MNIQSPQLLTDLYADLRDRRLLPLLVVLVVGIAVVPMALSKSPKAAAPPPAQPSAVAPKGSPLLAHPVVLSEPGLRDYVRRLHGDTPVDPFLPRVQGSGSSQTSSTGTVANGGLVPSSPTGSGSSSSGSNIGLTAEGKQAAAAANGTSSVPSSAPSSGGSSTGQVQTQNKFFFYRAKLRTGPVGQDLKVRDSVGPLTPLPGKDVPALEFLGVTTNGSFQPARAVFLVNSAVSALSGDGTCTFAGTYCQLVSLKPGDHEDLVWTDGVAYRIDLVKFDLVVRNNPPSVAGQGSSGSGSGSSNPVGRHFSF